MDDNDIFRGVGIEISLTKPDDFLKVRETLTRIGVAAKSENALYQSCHILHKQGRYAIVHFKELFALDGKPSTITENDLSRRNSIVKLLSEWGLVNINNQEAWLSTNPALAPLSQIKIIPHKEKANWILIPKYSIGSKKTTPQPNT